MLRRKKYGILSLENSHATPVLGIVDTRGGVLSGPTTKSHSNSLEAAPQIVDEKLREGYSLARSLAANIPRGSRFKDDE